MCGSRPPLRPMGLMRSILTLTTQLGNITVSTIIIIIITIFIIIIIITIFKVIDGRDPS